MMTPINEKLVILAGMFAATLFFALIPFKLVRLGHASLRRKILSYASCFSGGVFMAACILDLFPDVHEAMDHVLDEIEKQYHTKVDYPLSGFVICLGFFLVLFIEQGILHYKETSQGYQCIPGSNNSERAPLIANEHIHNENQVYQSTQNCETRDVSHFSAPSMSGVSVESVAPIYEPGYSIEESDHGHDHGHLDIVQHSTMRSLLLLIALSFHSIFEGIAIGLQKDLGQLISLFLAVIAHKAVMAFSLGLSLAQVNLTAKQYLMSILTFTVASPIGMLIGIGICDMEQSLAGGIANSVLQGMAGGTFLYITFFEVLPHEMNQKEPNRMCKLLFVTLGFACICGLLFITH